MSIVALGVRSAALALTLLCLVPASSAWALISYTFSCTRNPNTSCQGADAHTYDKQRATAIDRDDAYVASWLVNPGTGNALNVIFGWGSAGGDYRTNTDLFLYPQIGNYSTIYNLRMFGEFHY